jgi:hypothetical protein
MRGQRRDRNQAHWQAILLMTELPLAAQIFTVSMVLD